MGSPSIGGQGFGADMDSAERGVLCARSIYTGGNSAYPERFSEYELTWAGRGEAT